MRAFVFPNATQPLWQYLKLLVRWFMPPHPGRAVMCRQKSRERPESEEERILMSAYASIARSVETMGLEGVWDLKPMLNGGEVTGILPNLPRGPEFATVMTVSRHVTCYKSDPS